MGIKKLKSRRSKEYFKAAKANPFFKILDVQHKNGDDLLIFEVQASVPNHPKYDIRKREEIAVVLSNDDAKPPKVLALRTDFPNVPHMNLEPKGEPKSLCLFNQDYSELRLKLTPHHFLERIREWLSLTSMGKLHQADQPLEPFMLNSTGTLVLKNIDIGFSGGYLPLKVQFLKREDEAEFFGFAEPCEINALREKTAVVGFVVRCTAEHGNIRHTPLTLEELCEVLACCKADLVAVIRNFLTKEIIEKSLISELQNKNVIILLGIEQIREPNSPAENTEFWAFFLYETTIADLGIAVGVFQRIGGQIGVIIEQCEQKGLKNIPILPFKCVSSLTRELASQLSGKTTKVDSFFCVGAGALGSQVILNLVREGLGKWVIVDKDRILPHNRSRYGLVSNYSGLRKVEALELAINDFIGESDAVKGLPCDILNPGKYKKQINSALGTASIILDFSASTAVGRHLARDTKSKIPRLSAFLSPNGQYSVVLFEGLKRMIRLDDLEMQFYAAAIRKPFFRSYFEAITGEFRYSGSCSDITTVLPQDRVAFHSAVVSSFIHDNYLNPTASINLWQFRSPSEIHHERVQGDIVVEQRVNSWCIRTRIYVIEQMTRLRSEKLPNETGGILLGNFDVFHRTLYICDLVPSPEDSEEWPTCYIRGSKGLQEFVEDIRKRTGYSLDYVGEWHSHPMSAKPSSDDLKVCDWVFQYMRRLGLPGVLAIIGAKSIPNYLIKIP